MPKLVTTPSRDVQHHNVDTEKDKVRKDREGNLKSRLRCRSSQAAGLKGLCLEEISQWSQSLGGLLASKYGMQIFSAFLKSEFSYENLEFWLVCEEYKKTKSTFRMESRAKKLFKRYIEADAPREVNIDQQTREMIRRGIQMPTPACFDDAQRIVYSLMEKDSYPRFLKSDIYGTLLDSSLKK